MFWALAVGVACIGLLLSSMVFGLGWTWFYVFGTVGFAFLIAAPWALPLFWYRYVNRSARKLHAAGRQKKVPAYIVHDSGRGAITLLEEKRGEGVVMTELGRYMILPRIISEVPEAAPKEVEGGKKKVNPAEATTKTAEQKLEEVKERYKFDYASEWLAKRTIDYGTGLPFYIGYAGKLCLFHPLMMALYEAGKLFIPTDEKPFPETEKEKQLPRPLMLLDPRRIKTIVNRCFDTSQLAAIIIDAEERGRLGRPLPRWLIGVGAILVIVLIVGGLIYFLPKMM